MKNNANPTLFILSTLIVAGGAYWYFFTGTGNEKPLTPVAQVNPVRSQFQVLVSKLQPISFDTSIFSDPRFNALVDLSTPIFPETPGRLDPFAPLTGVSAN